MDYIGNKCPVCEKNFHADDDIVVCPDCGTPHHRECYEAIGHCHNEERHREGYDYTEQPHENAERNVIYCRSCGKENDKDAFFCKYCAAPLSRQDGQTANNSGNTRQNGPQQGGFGQGFPGSGAYPFMDPLGGVAGDTDFGDGVTARTIGYLPQQTDVQRDFPASVREIVLSGCLGHDGFRPFYSRADKALAQRSMERMNITDLSRRCYRELSGGQQQRVLLARALCATEKLLLLDEPVAGLDPKVTAEMYELIESLNKNDGVTVIMISHDIDKALCYASHILHIGDEIFFGTQQAYLDAKRGKRKEGAV